MNIPNAPPALARLLQRLLAEANTIVSQHATNPRPDVWYAGHGLYGDFGPYATAEDAGAGVALAGR